MIKNNIGENLLRYSLKNHKFVCFDAETENLNLSINNKPWELGYVIIQNGEIVEEHNRKIWWDDLNISEDAARITRFNYDDYKREAEPAEEVLRDFEKILYNKNYLNLSYNGLNFDVYIHNLFRQKLGLKPDWSFMSRSIDVLSLARAWRLNMSPPDTLEKFVCWQISLANYLNDDRLRKDRKTKSCALGTLSRELGIHVQGDNWHSGLYDVKVTWEVFKKFVWGMEIQDVWR